MREIKFRGWYTGPLGNRMLSPEFHGPVNEIFNDPENKGRVVYMQYTGLTDKNGVEIYEGDIIEFDDCYGSCESGFMECRNRGVVDYDPETISFIFTNRDNVEMHEIDFDELVVLGNIHENPELLEVAE